ncbi:DUF5666 domain-containing protein [Actinoplanes sp. DH11]|uniref:DUF5666 domain-containing protein n=1 Tax=Actinoplanes sp. DH11 TaxID=2857011 RepID=UPI001E31587B
MRADEDTEVLPRIGVDAPPIPIPDNLAGVRAATAPRRWWNRTTVALAGLALAAGGFVGGAAAQERWGTEPAGVTTSGTVERVDGTTLRVRTAAGETVTVRTDGTTAVRLAQTATLDRLSAGQEVTVRGETDGEGVVTATIVTAG